MPLIFPSNDIFIQVIYGVLKNKKKLNINKFIKRRCYLKIILFLKNK